MKLYERLRDFMRVLLYTISFRFIFSVLGAVIKLVGNILYAGFIFLFLYVLFGAALYFLFHISPVFWDTPTILYTVGFGFWTIVSLAVCLKRLSTRALKARRDRLHAVYVRYLKRMEYNDFLETRRDLRRDKKNARSSLRAFNKKNRTSYFFEENDDIITEETNSR